MLTRVADELKDQPHMEQLRKDLLEEALVFYLDFLEERGDRDELRYETARALGRVGDIYHLLGRHAESEQTFRHSIELLEATRDLPDAAESRFLLAQKLFGLAQVLAATNQLEEAEAICRRSLELSRELVDADPSALDSMRLIAHCNLQLVVVLLRLGRPDEEQVALKAALAAWDQLVEEKPDYENRYAMTDTLVHAARSAAMRGRFAEAEKLLQRYMTTLEDLSSEKLTSDVKKSLASGWYARGTLFWQTRRFKDAVHAYGEAVSILEELTRDFPSMPRYRFELGSAHEGLGITYYTLQRFEDSKKAWQRAQKVLVALVDKYPNVPRYEYRLARAHSSVADAVSHLSQEEDAQEGYARAIALFDRLESHLGRDPEYRRDRASTYYNWADLLMRLGDGKRAIELFRRSADIWEKLVADYGNVPFYQACLASCLNGLAWLLVCASDTEVHDPVEAVRLAERAVGLDDKQAHYWQTLGVARYRTRNWKGTVQALTQSLELGSGGQPGGDWIFLAMAHARLGHPKAIARSFYDKAVAWMEEHKPDDEELKRFRAEAEEVLGIEVTENEGTAK
jgi:tetratricopeptide (TPR) repeat protein